MHIHTHTPVQILSQKVEEDVPRRRRKKKIEEVNESQNDEDASQKADAKGICLHENLRSRVCPRQSVTATELVIFIVKAVWPIPDEYQQHE